MTQTDLAQPAPAPEGDPPARSGRRLAKYGALGAATLAIFALSSAVGGLVHGPDEATIRATVIGRCNVVIISDIVNHSSTDFTTIAPGRTTVARRPDHGWTVTMPATLSGHVVDGVPDNDQVSFAKTCDFSPSAARSKTAEPEQLRAQMSGPKGQFDLKFAFDKATNSYVETTGSGLALP